MFTMSGVPRLKCRGGGLHQARSLRLDVVTLRLSDVVQLPALYDDEAEYRHGLPDNWRLAWRQLPDLSALARDPVIQVRNQMGFVGYERRTGRLIVNITVYLAGGHYQIGGTIEREHRGQGYGREALELVCSIAHHHLGIVHLMAACETTNEASRRWLASCGFSRVDGPPTHVLPNGRVVESQWWCRSDPTAKRRCHRR